MALSEGDYLKAEEMAVRVLLDDTGAGGLRESGAGPVVSIAAGDETAAGAFAQSAFPAVLVRATAKSETPAGPAFRVHKNFNLRFTVLHKSMDRADAEEKVRRICARLETLLREQTATDKQFAGLPDHIEGSEGVLVCSLSETVLEETRAESDSVTASARTSATVSVPCVFRYE